jgi:predicted  nucleic acid-binding Zn-ribbon protein
MDISGNYSLHDIMYYYQKNIRDYTDNIHEYNQIMTNYLNMVATAPRYYPRSPFSQATPTRQTPVFNTIFRNLLPRRNESDTILQLGIRPMEDVIVRPSVSQIQDATQEVIYDISMTNMTCPITLETFQEGEQVCQIRHCGHIFKRAAIQNWFQRNVRCPVCRYDIRTYVPPENEDGEDADEEEESAAVEVDEEVAENIENMDNGEFDDLVQELIREYPPASVTSSAASAASSILHNISRPSGNFTNNLTTAIRSFVNNELRNMPVNSSTTELLYTFDIPIGFDTSGNYRL